MTLLKKNKSEYNPVDPLRCNVGFILQAAHKKTPGELRVMVRDFSMKSYRDMYLDRKTYQPVLDILMGPVYAAGFLDRDMLCAEALYHGDLKHLAEGLTYYDPDDVAKYYAIWANQLDIGKLK